MINGVNSRLVSRITGNTIHEEVNKWTRTFDVVAWIRARRLQWAGHILRIHPYWLVHKAAHYIYKNRKEGDLLMDVPVTNSWRSLLMMAKERDKWRRLVNALKDGRKTAERQVTRTAHFTIKARQSPKLSSTAAAAGAAAAVTAYRSRDAHGTFFRPNAKKNTRNKMQARAPRNPKAFTRSRALTDKQRRSWAREHY